MQALKKSFSAEQGLDGVGLKASRDGISLAGARALLYSHVAMEMQRRQLFHQLGEDLARAILAQSGRHAGFNDAQLVFQTHTFDDDAERMFEAQYALLATSGFGRFDVLDLTVNTSARAVHARVRCHASPEAESHRRLFGSASTPACCHLVGYSTGWSSRVTSVRVLTVETHCIAKGDEYCEFETLPYGDAMGAEAALWKRAFESTSSSLAQQLRDKLETIERQMETITAQAADLARLSTPILQISDDVLVLPVIGTVDSARVTSMVESLMEEIVRRRASGVVIDVTGVAVLDSATASHLIGMVRAVRLLGSQAVLSGISPSMSQILVTQGIELGEIPTHRTLQDAVRFIDRRRR
ncbi:MAG TPA: STAS domain-containing protein [Labilithrix sp.]|nr:STAS domain-containing protein [Labilithrix sp.]